MSKPVPPSEALSTLGCLVECPGNAESDTAPLPRRQRTEGLRGRVTRVGSPRIHIKGKSSSRLVPGKDFVPQCGSSLASADLVQKSYVLWPLCAPATDLPGATALTPLLSCPQHAVSTLQRRVSITCPHHSVVLSLFPVLTPNPESCTRDMLSVPEWKKTKCSRVITQ